MKVIDTSGMEIVFSGKEWTHFSLLPCAKQAIPLLERNEQIVSWLKPSGGRVSDHIPAIRFKGKFYSLSLRMQKAIYRHIRLKKGFKNEEVMDGIAKLRIPDVLLKEKIRTQSRFDAMRKASSKKEDIADDPVKTPLPGDSTAFVEKKMKRKRKGASTSSSEAEVRDDEEEEEEEEAANSDREDSSLYMAGKKKGKKTKDDMVLGGENNNNNNNTRRERVKTTCTVSSRMKHVVEQMITCSAEEYMTTIQQTTIFAFKSHQSEIVSCFLEDMRRENSALMNNKQALLQLLDEAYEQSQSLIRMHCPPPHQQATRE